MGKIERINKSRKEFTCSKCRKIIPKGSPYLRGVLNFHPDIIRCTSCGLKSYEVTTSDYIQQVGAIIEDWQETYSVEDYQSIADELTSIKDDLQDRLDSMPEQLQYSETGELLQERIDGLDDAINQLEQIDEDTLKQEVIDERDDLSEDTDWDTIPDDLQDELYTEYDEKLSEAINEALGDIPM